MRSKFLLAGLMLSTVACSSPRRIERAQIADAQDSGIQLGEEYTAHSKTHAGGGGGSSTSSSSLWRSAALYIPNRIADFIDILRVDVGVGPSLGGVVRLSRWAQAGYREFSPLSVRIGLRGRRIPVFVERSSEVGIGPGFLQSHDREVAPGEVGVGLDLLVAGVYGGVCLDELADFIVGFGGLDMEGDDWE